MGDLSTFGKKWCECSSVFSCWCEWGMGFTASEFWASHEGGGKIQGMKPPCGSNCNDYVEWDKVKDGKFSTKNAYLTLSQAGDLVESPMNKGIWRWDGPEKIKFHLWKDQSGSASYKWAAFHKACDYQCKLPLMQYYDWRHDSCS